MKLPIYLDYMATTPVDPRVKAKMIECLDQTGNFGNPASRTHQYGWLADDAVEKAREQVADLINADPREIIWTSGATESDNIANAEKPWPQWQIVLYNTDGKILFYVKPEQPAKSVALDEIQQLDKNTIIITTKANLNNLQNILPQYQIIAQKNNELLDNKKDNKIAVALVPKN